MSRHHSTEEQRRHLEALQRSGLSLTHYARSVRLSPATLIRWRQAHDTTVRNPPVPSFIEIIPESPSSVSRGGAARSAPPLGTPWQIELTLPGGITLRVSGPELRA